MSNITKEEKREILKCIKKGKQFSTFYIACADAFADMPLPHNSLNSYLTNTVKHYLDTNTMDTFVKWIKDWIPPKRTVMMY